MDINPSIIKGIQYKKGTTGVEKLSQEGKNTVIGRGGILFLDQNIDHCN
jgi:hypothetical protein